MTNDQQQVEAWRKEFESKIGKIFPSLNFIWIDDEQKYMPFDTHLCWTTWAEAKRNQPVIELPDPDVFTLISDELPDLKSHSKESIISAITAAGYSYKVK